MGSELVKGIEIAGLVAWTVWMDWESVCFSRDRFSACLAFWWSRKFFSWARKTMGARTDAREKKTGLAFRPAQLRSFMIDGAVEVVGSCAQEATRGYLAVCTIPPVPGLTWGAVVVALPWESVVWVVAS